MSAEKSRLPLRTGLRIVLAIALVVVLVGGVITFAALTRLNDDTTELIDRISPARVEAGNLATAYVDQETGVRGFVLTRDDTFLAPYAAGQMNAASADRAVAGYLDTPRIRQSLAAIAAAGAAWRADFADPTIARARRAPVDEQVKVNERLGKARFDVIRQRVTELNDAITVERRQARDRVDNGLGRVRILVGGAFIAIVLAGAGVWFALRRLVLGPLAQLAQQTRTVAAGDFEHRVDGQGPAEIRALSTDVEQMRGRLAVALKESLAASDSVRTQAEQLAAQADELELQAQDLRRSNEELEQFAYVASHDLQEPLRKVASFCQMLQRRYGGQLDDRADQYIDFAVDGSKRMQQLINDLLAFSRVGRTTAEWTEVDTAVIARHAVDALGDLIEEAGASIEFGDLPVVHGDDALLTQVFQNLIANGIKFRAPERPPVIRVGAEREDDVWHFRCEDNGIGIDPQYADRIFVIFQRLHSKDQYTGTGIGLSLCKKIVEYHGGRIWLDTERNGQPGTTVHWTLPVEPVAIAPTHATAATAKE